MVAQIGVATPNVGIYVPTPRERGARYQIIYVAIVGHEAIVWILLGREANAESGDDRGRRVFHYAAGNGQVAVVWCLLERTNVKAKNGSGKMALGCAPEGRHEPVAWLLKSGPEV